jgi:NADP-dependent 3-hydroxy acid dehydrogenase YdfG
MSSSLTVAITGASSGIGAEYARQYATRGARLALLARRVDRLEAVAAECRARGAADALVLPTDVTDPAAVRASFARLADRLGGLDRAILNAGGYGVRSAAELAHSRDVEWSAGAFSAAAAQRVMQLNYGGTVSCLEAALAIMRDRGGGVIAATGAQAADRGYPLHGPYAAAKAAVRALFDALRADAARAGIAMVLVEPGCVVSELTENQCCDEMPFLQPTTRAVAAFIAGVEARRAVVRFPLHGSLLSHAAAAAPRALFDRWARRRLDKAGV